MNTGNSIGRVLLSVLAGFAQFEADLIRERTTAALQHKKAHGEVYSNSVYGFDAKDGQLAPNAREQAVFERMRTLRAEGVSYNEIANTLNDDQVPTKRGGAAWHTRTIKNILEAAR